MIYLFRKRNGSIILTSKESAHGQFATPNNFITFQPEFLGAVQPAAIRALDAQLDEKVPMVIEKLVKKDGEDVLITLTQDQINDQIAEGDTKVERLYEKLLERRTEAYNALLEELATTADTSLTPISYDRKIGAVDDARGDVSGVLSGYQQTQ